MLVFIVKLIIAIVIAVLTIVREWPGKYINTEKRTFRALVKWASPILVALLLFGNDLLSLFSPVPVTEGELQQSQETQTDEITSNFSDTLRAYFYHTCSDTIDNLNRSLTEKDNRNYNLAFDKLIHGDFRGALSLGQSLIPASGHGCVRSDIANIVSACYSALSIYDSAYHWSNEALESDDGNSLLWCNRAAIADRAGRPDSALELYGRALEIDDRNAGAFLGRGLVNESVGDLIHAEADYLAAVSIDSGMAQAWNNLGAVRNRLNKSSQAFSDFLEAIRADSSYATAWANLGRSYHRAKRNIDAKAALCRAVDLDSSSANTWYDLGIVQIHLRDFGEALISLQRALSINPDHKQAWNASGTALQLLNRPKEALVAHNRAISLDSAYCGAWESLSGAQHRLGDFKAALSSNDSALDCDSTLAIAWHNRAVLLAFGFHDYKSALECVNRAIGLGSSLEEAKVFRRKLLDSADTFPK